MATFEKYIHDFTFQEGNESDIELIMDDSFSMIGVTCSLQVRNSRGKLLIEKGVDDITIIGQEISIPISSEDTKRNSGKHNYEIDFINLAGKPFATVGGVFEIQEEINRT